MTYGQPTQYMKDLLLINFSIRRNLYTRIVYQLVSYFLIQKSLCRLYVQLCPTEHQVGSEHNNVFDLIRA